MSKTVRLPLVRGAISLSLCVALIIAVASPAVASTYRYDCTKRPADHVVATFPTVQYPNGVLGTANLLCGVEGDKGGYGVDHIVGDDLSMGDPALDEYHFGGYMSDWEAYAIAKTMQTAPVVQGGGNWRYEDVVPIFENGNNQPIGTQDFVVVLDPLLFAPPTVKTAYAWPEDIRTITQTYYKLDGWTRPNDWGTLVR